MWGIHEDGAVWPWMWIICGLLVVWGLLLDRWQVPAVIFVTYVAVRAIVMGMPVELHEVGIGAAWLCAGAIFLLYFNAWLPGFFCTVTGLVYPILIIFGFRLEYMGLIAIVGEVSAVLALISIGGGLYGLTMAGDPSNPSVSRSLPWYTAFSLGVAAR